MNFPRLVAITLALAVVFPLVSAENLVKNGDFQQGVTIPNWNKGISPDTDATIDLDIAGCYSLACLKITLNNAQSAFANQNVGGLQPGATYHLIAQTKASTGTNLQFGIYDKQWKNNECREVGRFMTPQPMAGEGEWKSVAYTFTVPFVDDCGAINSAHDWYVYLYAVQPNVQNMPVYFDSIILSPKHLVKNGGFEETNTQWRFAHEQNVNPTFEIISDNCMSGKCLSIKLNNAERANANQVLGSLTPGAKYRLSTMVKAPSDSNFLIGLSDAKWRDSSCKAVGKFINSGNEKGSGGWKAFNFDVEIPQKDDCGPIDSTHTWIYHLYAVKPNSDAVKFDHVALTELPWAKNGGFEFERDYWAPVFEPGSKAKIEISKNGCIGSKCLEITLNNAELAFVTQSIGTLKPTKKYTFEAKAKSFDGTAMMDIYDGDWRDASCKRVGKRFSTTMAVKGNDWKTITQLFTVPERDDCGAIDASHNWYLHLYSLKPNPQNSPVYFDSAILFEGGTSTPGFEFELSSSPNSLKILKGQSAISTITVTKTNGEPKTVSLTVSCQQPGITCALSPSSGIPEFTSVLTITTVATTPIGISTIAVEGESEGKKKSTSLSIEIVDKPPAGPVCGNLVCDNNEDIFSCVQDCWAISTYGQYNKQEWIDQMPINHLRFNFVTFDEQTIRAVLKTSQAKSLFVKIQYSTSTFTPQQKQDYEKYASDVSLMSTKVGEIYSFSIDDFNGYWSRSGFDSTHLDRMVAATKSANSKVQFSITAYEDDFDENKYGSMPQETRSKIDIVILGLHFRKNGAKYADYVVKAKQTFPNAKVIALAYAYDRIDYVGCDSLNGAKCTREQELELFAEAMEIQAKLLAQGEIIGIEFYPDAFGYEDNSQFIKWGTKDFCKDVSRCQICGDPARCIDVTQRMRKRTNQILCKERGDCVASISNAAGASELGFYGPSTWRVVPPSDPDKDPYKEFFQRAEPLTFTIRNSVRVDGVNWICGSDKTNERLKLVKDEIDAGYLLNPRRKMLLSVYFWDGSAEQNGYNYPLKDKRVYQSRIDCALKTLGSSVDKLYGIVLGEEQDPQNSKRAKMLDDLYTGTKAKYPDLQIYQWYLYSFNPDNPLRIRIPETYEGTYVHADGWVMEILQLSARKCPDHLCHLSGDPYRNTAQKYIIAGKPVLTEIWAGTTRPDYWLNEQDLWSTMDEQFNTNVEFNLPTALYWYACKFKLSSPCKPSSGVDTQTAYFNTTKSYFLNNEKDYEMQLDMNAKISNYLSISEFLPSSYSGKATQQNWIAHEEIILPCTNGISYAEEFSNNNLVDITSGTGFRQLAWEPGSLGVHSFDSKPIRASITYKFSCQNAVSSATAKAKFILNEKTESKVVLEISKDKINWYNAESKKSGELRVDLGGSTQEKTVYLRISFSSKSTDPEKNSIILRSIRLSAGAPGKPGVPTIPNDFNDKTIQSEAGKFEPKIPTASDPGSLENTLGDLFGGVFDWIKRLDNTFYKN